MTLLKVVKIVCLLLSIDSVTSGTRGEDLADLVNDYRQSYGLSRVPFSKTLMEVASRHVEISCRLDSVSNRDCWNPHSWDYIPGLTQDYETCCYSPMDGNTGYCMWLKPKEIGGWDEDGYEITAGAGEDLSDSLDAWKKSSGHNDVILQKNTWKYMDYQAIGCAATQGGGGTAHCWFANDKDPSYYRSQGEVDCPINGNSGDSSPESDCVYLSISGARPSIEGTYRKSGTANGFTAYDGPSSNWLYKNAIGEKSYWTISTTKGGYGYSNGYCWEDNVLDCNGQWNGGSYGSDMKWSSCSSGFEIDEANEGQNKVGVRIALIVGGLVMVLACGIVLCLYIKKRKRRGTQGTKVLEEEEVSDIDVEVDGEATLTTKTIE